MLPLVIMIKDLKDLTGKISAVTCLKKNSFMLFSREGSRDPGALRNISNGQIISMMPPIVVTQNILSIYHSVNITMSRFPSCPFYLTTLPSLAKLKFWKITIIMQDNIILASTNQKQRNSMVEIVLCSASWCSQETSPGTVVWNIKCKGL